MPTIVGVTRKTENMSNMSEATNFIVAKIKGGSTNINAPPHIYGIFNKLQTLLEPGVHHPNCFLLLCNEIAHHGIGSFVGNFATSYQNLPFNFEQIGLR